MKMVSMLSKIMKVSGKGKRGIHLSAVRRSAEHDDHEHYVFGETISRKWINGLAIFIMGGGICIPFALVKYQNWKNGFPRDED